MRFVLPQLHDIRHRKLSGVLDLERMRVSPAVLDLRTSRGEVDASFVRRALPVHVTEAERIAMHVAFAVALTKAGMRNSEQSDPYGSSSHREESSILEMVPAAMPQESSFRELQGIATSFTRPRLPKTFVLGLLIAALLVPSLAAIAGAATMERSLVNAASDAVRALETAAGAMKELDSGAAEGAFGEAEEQFRDAHRELTSVGLGALSLLAELPLSAKLTTGKALLEAGEDIAAGGIHMSRALGMVRLISPETLLAAVAPLAESPHSQKNASAQEFGDFEQELTSAANLLASAARSLERVDAGVVPEPYRERVVRLKAALPQIRSGIETLEESAHALAGILGMQGTRRYLVLLQNASERRPTGGFIGNVAIATVRNGRLEELRVEDSYLFDGQLVRYTVPPKPIQDISAAWSLHDANWFRDFPTSAKVAAGFFEETGALTPDGVIAVNSRTLERLLEVMGPVTVPGGPSVDSRSFVDLLNTIGADQRPGETTQVRMMSSLLPALLARFPQVRAEGDAGAGALEALRESVLAGDLMVWFRDLEEEAFAKFLGASGALPSANSDFLAIVAANINGFKTDRVIEESVRHEAVVDADGGVVDTVTLTRQHRGNERQEQFYRQVNKTYLRILVPQGAELLAAEGFTCDPYEPPMDYRAAEYRVHEELAVLEATTHPSDGNACVEIGEESGKASFGGWVFVSPGETLAVRLTYRLPLRLQGPVDSYRLLVAKQPGSEPMFSAVLRAPPGWRIAWHDEGFADGGSGEFATFPEPLVRNRFFGAVLVR
ncbi:MAG: hypothetical protein A2991_03680 [Candidatus Terrybacteria bacterium RIFCSPLOWO2_01_FULL_58_14]|uniref:DUF4012 domain-containing protein n=1 Tax=Candidatus Terrybacteria bacterium RIFCSPLOWO2_01_FULL_58_14 TaxID=1802369 RepID=A0A1G2Q2P9_9BACT|nr:MAG: hypothetical protein A2991_03680 [Candidatus Terrybacteria bacterium RIFCSPLOWO2_01_FULL_58_14]